MRYVIDIDGTICTSGTTEETRYTQALPIRDRIGKINKLYDDGHTIIYLTARGMGRHKNNADLARKEFYEFTEIQLSLWGCKYHELFLGKPSGDYYIDDKGVNSDDFFGD
jgi:phosphatidate phosphatase PAH1